MQTLSSAELITGVDFTDWMSFLPSYVKGEIIPNPEALRKKTESL